jgi:hypothetical protein
MRFIDFRSFQKMTNKVIFIPFHEAVSLLRRYPSNPTTSTHAYSNPLLCSYPNDYLLNSRNSEYESLENFNSKGDSDSRVQENLRGDCCICLGPNQDNTPLVYCETVCGMVYHSRCIRNYNQSKCPHCRQPTTYKLAGACNY